MTIQYQQETFDLVENRLDMATDYANQAWGLVSTFLTNLQDPTLYDPDFTEVDVGTMPAAPPNNFNYSEPPFQSDLYDTLAAALTDLIQNGGTGLDEDVENAIWERARARQELANERTYNEALQFYAARGWTIPPGALGGRLAEALTEQTRADAQLNYEIMIKQAELAQKNSELAKATASEVLKNYFDYFNKYADRTLEAAKAQVLMAVELFKAEIEKFKAKVDVLIKNADVNMKIALEANALRLETIKAGASVAAQLTASALAGTSVGAHLQYEGGYRYSFSESEEERRSESHNYNYEFQM